MEVDKIRWGIVSVIVIGLLLYWYSSKGSIDSTHYAITQGQFNPALIETRQKCQIDAKQWSKEHTRSDAGGFDQVLSAHFNTALNTCLVEYMFNQSQALSQTSKIIDIYESNRVLLELDIDSHPSTAGEYLGENGNKVKLFPWQNPLDEYNKRKAVLLEIPAS